MTNELIWTLCNEVLFRLSAQRPRKKGAQYPDCPYPNHKPGQHSSNPAPCQPLAAEATNPSPVQEGCDEQGEQRQAKGGANRPCTSAIRLTCLQALSALSLSQKALRDKKAADQAICHMYWPHQFLSFTCD